MRAAQILKGLHRSYAHFAAAMKESDELNEKLRITPRDDPGREALVAQFAKCNDRVHSEAMRVVGAVQFYIGVKS